MPTLQADLDLQIDQSLERLTELDDALLATAQRFGDDLATAIANAASAAELDDSLNESAQRFESEMITAIANAAVGADLDNSLSESASRFEGELTTALANASTAIAPEDIVFPVIVDTSTAEADLQDLFARIEGEPATISIVADTAAAEGEIADVVSTADGEEASINVTADTSDAEGALSDLADSADSVASSTNTASDGVSNLQQHATLLAGASGLAVGEVGGLEKTAASLGPSAALAAGATAALAVGVTGLFRAGLEATSAQQRYNFVLGEMKTAVEAVHVGNLNTDLFELTRQMGSTQAATQNAAATVFQFALNANATTAEARQFTDSIFALASRAVALRPSLGDVTDVATRMEVGLGRARSAAQQFGIAISQADINTRGLADTGKTSAAELTAYEKSVAGAEIALERYGTTLDQTITKGSENASIQQRRLTSEFQDFLEEAGKQLVVPGLEVLRAGIPIAEAFAQVLSSLAPILHVVAEGLNLIGPAIAPVVVGFLAFKAVDIATAALTAFGVKAGLLPAQLTPAAEVNAVFAASTTELAVSTDAAAGGLILLGDAAAAATPEIVAADTAMDANPIGLFAAAIAVAATAFGLFGGGADDSKQKLTQWVDELKKANDPLTQFDKTINDTVTTADKLGLKIDAAQLRLKAFRDVANENVGVAQRLVDDLAAAGRNTDAYQRILDRANKTQAEANAAQSATAQAADRAAVAIGAQQKLVDAAATSQHDFAAGTASASQALKDEQAASQSASDALSLYKDELDKVLGIHIDEAEASIQFANSLQKITDAVVKNGAALGLDNQAQRDNEQSVIDSTKAAEDLAAATFRRVASTDGEAAATKAANESLARFTGQIRDTLIAQGLSVDATDALLRSLGLLTAAGDPAALSIEAWGSAAATSGPQVVAAANTVGTTSATAIASPDNQKKHKDAAATNITAYASGLTLDAEAATQANTVGETSAGEMHSPGVETAHVDAGKANVDAYSRGVREQTKAARDAMRTAALAGAQALAETDSEFDAQGAALLGAVNHGFDGPIGETARRVADTGIQALAAKEAEFDAQGAELLSSVNHGFDGPLGETARRVADTGIQGLASDDAAFQAQGEALLAATGRGMTLHDLEGEGRRKVEAVVAQLEGLAAVGGEWDDLGFNLMVGVARGLTAASPAVVKAAQDALNQALDKARADNFVESPSRRWAAELGLPLAQGVALGITQGAAGIGIAATDAVTVAVTQTASGIAAAVAAVPSRQAVAFPPLGSPTSTGISSPGATQGPGAHSGGVLVHVEHLDVSTPSPSPVDAGFESAKALGAEVWRLGIG